MEEAIKISTSRGSVKSAGTRYGASYSTRSCTWCYDRAIRFVTAKRKSGHEDHQIINVYNANPGCSYLFCRGDDSNMRSYIPTQVLTCVDDSFTFSPIFTRLFEREMNSYGTKPRTKTKKGPNSPTAKPPQKRGWGVGIRPRTTRVLWPVVHESHHSVVSLHCLRSATNFFLADLCVRPMLTVVSTAPYGTISLL